MTWPFRENSAVCLIKHLAATVTCSCRSSTAERPTDPHEPDCWWRPVALAVQLEASRHPGHLEYEEIHWIKVSREVTSGQPAGSS